MSLNLLITGANGQVGWQLQRTLASLGEVTAFTREQLDLSDLDSVSGVIRELEPDILVNAAAYTAVDKAESEPDQANAINAKAPGRMAQELVRNGGLLVHYSSDYVFDGSKPVTEAYEESDQTAPLNVYGQSKLDGERLIVESGCAHVILRTSWVYDIRGKNFLRTVLRLAREREELRMVGDQYGAPTWARSIAEATAAIVARNLEFRSQHKQWRTGLFHLTAAGQTSWAGFAEGIIQEHETISAGTNDGSEFGSPLKAKRVVSITAAEYPTPARRPRNSTLNNGQVETNFGITMPNWREQLRLAMQDAVR
jgi:dTDP-4-dehydrorhamnose reductase